MNNITCIFCGTTNNINTSLTINVDGVKISVNICDAHAETATVSSARAAYLDNKAKIDAFIVQAAAMGLTFVPATNDLIQVPNGIPTLKQQPSEVPTNPLVGPNPNPTLNQLTPDSPVANILENEEDVIPTSKLERLVRSVGGSVENSGIKANVPAYQSHAIIQASNRDGSTLDPAVRDGKAKITMVEGRAGMPLAIPTMRTDGTGITRIQIRKMTPSEFDRRAKNAADDSVRDRGPDFRNSYDLDQERACPICSGAGTTVNMGRNITCPKCGGIGTIG